jgi:hypothetical protein
MDGSPAAQLAQVSLWLFMRDSASVCLACQHHTQSEASAWSCAADLPTDPGCVPIVQRVKLDRSQAASAPAIGDVLRACTCTTFVFPTNSLFGAKPPQRTIVAYGADQQKWTQVRLPAAVDDVHQHVCCVTNARQWVTSSALMVYRGNKDLWLKLQMLRRS